MDRYNSHTRQCRSCAQALKRLRALKPWLWGGLWLSAVLMGLGQLGALSLLGVLLAIATGLVMRQVSRWERGLLAGDGLAPRNHG